MKSFFLLLPIKSFEYLNFHPEKNLSNYESILGSKILKFPNNIYNEFHWIPKINHNFKIIKKNT